MKYVVVATRRLAWPSHLATNLYVRSTTSFPMWTGSRSYAMEFEDWEAAAIVVQVNLEESVYHTFVELVEEK